jgi:hypothetical protein
MLDARFWILDPSAHPNSPADNADNADLDGRNICVICGKTIEGLAEQILHEPDDLPSRRHPASSIQHPASSIENRALSLLWAKEREDSTDVVPGFLVRRDSFVALDGGGTGVVCGESEGE